MNLMFDLDGTLTDPNEGFVGCVQYAFERLGLPAPPPEAIRRHVGPPLRETFAQLLGERKALIEPAVASYRERYAAAGIWETTLYTGIPEAIEQLCKTATLFVVTSKPAVFAQRIVDSWPFAAAFSGVYGSELNGVRDDKRELIAHVLAVEHLDPARTAMIGDRTQDIVAARQNGVLAFGVTWGYGTLAELKDAGALTVFSSARDLAQYFYSPQVT